jgi:hypothetical protein
MLIEIQRIIDLFISFLSVYCILTNTYVVECASMIRVSLLSDCLFQVTRIKQFKPDFFLHHILGLFFIQYYLQHMDETADADGIIRTILTVEISSIFLTLRYFRTFLSKALQQINDILFVCTFFYFRIYFYPVHLFTPAVYKVLSDISKDSLQHAMIFVAMYGLYGLNVYWGHMILRKLIDTDANQT